MDFRHGSHGRRIVPDRQTNKEGALVDKPDINSCTVEDLENILNIGHARARAIIADRERFGRFESLDDINSVYGIADPTVKAIADNTTIDGMDWYEYEESKRSGQTENAKRGKSRREREREEERVH